MGRPATKTAQASNNQNADVVSEATAVSKHVNMDDKIVIKNIAPWQIGFANILTTGDVLVQPNATARVRRDEIIEQVNSGNTLFCGTDRTGAHPTLIIEDKETLDYLDFDCKSFISEQAVAKLFDIKDQAEFERRVKEVVATRAEKAFLISAIEKLNLNDHRKIQFCETYAKFRLI